VKPYIKVPSLNVRKEGAIKEPDFVVLESVLELRVNDNFLAAFVCSPGLEKELALGYLRTSGHLESLDDVISLEYSNYLCKVELKSGTSLRTDEGFSQLRRFYGTECSAPDVLYELRTGGDLPLVTNSLSFTKEVLFNASKTMRDSQIIFQKTGATHAALLCDIAGQNSFSAEDIGRHNAVDKVIGLALDDSFKLENSFLFVSGRLTADMVSKCAWCGIPLVASNSATTDSGIKFAKKANVTLVGFQRGSRFRIYHEGAAIMEIRDS
jgi:FdhD protein